MKKVLSFIAGILLPVVRFILSVILGVPYKYKNVWYNRSLYCKDEKFPIVFNSDGTYIPPLIGARVIMDFHKDDTPIYYEIVDTSLTPGSDWIRCTDNLNCVLRISNIGDLKK